MEEEWHVSDSEEEDINAGNTSKIINSRLEKLRSLSQKDPKMFSDENYMPENLIDLYERIANEGFIALRCKGSNRLASLESKEDETQNMGISVDNENPPHAPLTIDNINNSTVENKPTISNEFDYKEELFETTVLFPPRRTPKSGKKAKRVGTMENVINDLNRFRKMNTQTMANRK